MQASNEAWVREVGEVWHRTTWEELDLPPKLAMSTLHLVRLKRLNSKVLSLSLIVGLKRSTDQVSMVRLVSKARELVAKYSK